MELMKPSKAGTYESNDIYIMLFPNAEETSIELESNVYETFGEAIKKVILETLSEFNIKNVLVRAIDKGALDFTIRARLITAIKRGANHE
ncbi:citrate lyase acyl carrier protein [Haloplasma contractile]|uniref:Citrate lyase acyl carrier protein n=1 Tax=Haloplasma contractile SSD-17B TaxID=1033810 RepID=U2FMA3_9MOLU|nr:citrate lyase acyl carrier protein [Haloplasma contractile]ERJ13850.1 Citrate lyase acyl carrier protein [Haloplasma contractile SSD-17B]